MRPEVAELSRLEGDYENTLKICLSESSVTYFVGLCEVQKAIHDRAVTELSFFLADYCEYGPTNERFDECSRFYAETTYRTNRQLCREVTKECRSATCDELSYEDLSTMI